MDLKIHRVILSNHMNLYVIKIKVLNQYYTSAMITYYNLHFTDHANESHFQLVKFHRLSATAYYAKA